jgi:hypothetical protein
MGDERHKKSPPQAKEPVTDLFRKQVEAALARNAVHNAERGLRKGTHGYRPENHADLADETGADANTIKHLLGGVRAGTKTKKISRSSYVPIIRRVLGIAQIVTTQVPANRLKLVERIASMPDDAFRDFEASVERLDRESRANSR